jgi:16S rRNA (uracil1498-N3)-methyltransferase
MAQAVYMTKARLHISAEVIQHNPQLIPLDKWQSNYVVNVLRMRRGDAVTIFDGEGKEYSAVIDETGDKVAALKIIAAGQSEQEAGVRIACAVAVSKGKKMPLVVQKLTELGVSDIIPILTKRTVVALRDKSAKKGKWNATAIEAAKQCGRKVLPAISEPMAFDDLIRTADGYDLKLIAYEESTEPIRPILRHFALSTMPASVIIVIGPEGGFDPKEVKAAEKAGFHVCSFGKTVLKCDTAAIVAAAVLAYEFCG